jgi:hypothetical protein
LICGEAFTFKNRKVISCISSISDSLALSIIAGAVGKSFVAHVLLIDFPFPVWEHLL